MIQTEMFPVTSSSPLVGAAVFLDRTCDQRNPCCSNTGLITVGTVPHAASIICGTCGRHRGWLSRDSVQKLHRVIECFGVPAEPMTIRDPSSHFTGADTEINNG
jgi:hypothetical protein